VASDDLGPFVDAAFRAGVDVIGFRDETLNRVEAIEQLALLRTLSYQTQGLVVVQDDPGLAEAFTADLLHLDENDTPPAEAKKILHKWALVGRGAHTEQQARAAVADELVDFITVGPEHPTATDPALVRTMAEIAPPGAGETKPWFATGGTSLQDIDEVLAAGARRIVVGSEIRDAAGPEDAARAIRERIDAAWDGDPAMNNYLSRAWNHAR